MGVSQEFNTILTLDPSGSIAGHRALEQAERRHQAEVRQLNTALKAQKTELATMRGGLDAGGRAHVSAADKARKYLEQMRATELMMSRYGVSQQAASRAVRAFGSDTSRARAEARRYATELDRTQREVRQLAAEQRRANTTTSLSGSIATKTARAFTGLAAGFIGVHAASAQVRAGLRDVIEEAEELKKLETLVGIPAELLAEWHGEIRRLSAETGVGVAELIRAMFQITSDGERGASALNLLRDAARASAIGLGSAADIGKIATAATQAYGEAAFGAVSPVDILRQTIKLGALETDALASVMGQAIPQAQNLGVSFAELGGFVATLSRLGLNAENSMTALRAVLTALLKPSKEAEDTLRAAGSSMAALRAEVREKGLAEALVGLTDRFEGNETALARVIPNARALIGVLGTAGTFGREYTEIASQMTDATDRLGDAFARLDDDPAFELRKVRAELQAIRSEIASGLLPLLADVSRALLDVSKAATDSLREAGRALTRGPGRAAGIMVGREALAEEVAGLRAAHRSVLDLSRARVEASAKAREMADAGFRAGRDAVIPPNAPRSIATTGDAYETAAEKAKRLKREQDSLVEQWEALKGPIERAEIETQKYRTVLESLRATIRRARADLGELRAEMVRAGTVTLDMRPVSPTFRGPGVDTDDVDTSRVAGDPTREALAEGARRYAATAREETARINDAVLGMLDQLAGAFEQFEGGFARMIAAALRLVAAIQQASAASSMAAGGGAAGGGLGGAALGGLAAVAPVLAVFTALYQLGTDMIARRRAERFALPVSGGVSGGLFSGQALLGSSAAITQEQGLEGVRQIRSQIQALELALGSLIDFFPELGIEVQNSGEQFRLLIGGVVHGLFASWEAAMSEGLRIAAAGLEAGDLGENTARALGRISASTFEELLGLLPRLFELDRVAAGASVSLARTTHAMLQRLTLLDHESRMLIAHGVPLDQVIAHREREIAAMERQIAVQGLQLVGIGDITGGLQAFVDQSKAMQEVHAEEVRRRDALTAAAERASTAVGHLGSGPGSGGDGRGPGRGGGLIKLGTSADAAVKPVEELSGRFVQMVTDATRAAAQASVLGEFLDFQERYGVELRSNDTMRQRIAELEFRAAQIRIQLLALEIARNREILGLTRAQVEQFATWAREIAALDFGDVTVGGGTGRGTGGRRDARERIRETFAAFMSSLEGVAGEIASQRQRWADYIAEARRLGALTEEQIAQLQREITARERLSAASEAADIMLRLATIIGDEALIADLQRERTRLEIVSLQQQARMLHELGAIGADTLGRIVALGDRALAAIAAAEGPGGASLTAKPPPPTFDVDASGKPTRQAIESSIARLVPSIARRLEVEETIRQFEELSASLRKLGASEEQIARARAEAADRLFADLADQILRYVDDEQLALEVARVRWTLEVAQMRLHLHMLEQAGILTRAQIATLSRGIALIEEQGPPTATGDLVRPAPRGRRESAGAAASGETIAEILDELRRAAMSPAEALRQDWLDMIARIREATGSAAEKAQALALAEAAYNRERLRGLRELQDELDAAGGATPGGRAGFFAAQGRFRGALAGGDEAAIEAAARALLGAAGGLSSAFGRRSAEAAAREEILAAIGPLLGGGIAGLGPLSFGAPAAAASRAAPAQIVLQAPRDHVVADRLERIEAHLGIMVSTTGRTATATERSAHGFDRLEPVLRRL